MVKLKDKKIFLGLFVLFLIVPTLKAIIVEENVTFNDEYYNYTTNTTFTAKNISVHSTLFYINETEYCDSNWQDLFVTNRLCLALEEVEEAERKGGNIYAKCLGLGGEWVGNYSHGNCMLKDGSYLFTDGKDTLNYEECMDNNGSWIGDKKVGYCKKNNIKPGGLDWIADYIDGHAKKISKHKTIGYIVIFFVIYIAYLALTILPAYIKKRLSRKSELRLLGITFVSLILFWWYIIDRWGQIEITNLGTMISAEYPFIGWLLVGLTIYVSITFLQNIIPKIIYNLLERKR